MPQATTKLASWLSYSGIRLPDTLILQHTDRLSFLHNHGCIRIYLSSHLCFLFFIWKKKCLAHLRQGQRRRCHLLQNKRECQIDDIFFSDYTGSCYFGIQGQKFRQHDVSVSVWSKGEGQFTLLHTEAEMPFWWILITEYTGNCHFDKFQYTQWWKFRHYDDMSGVFATAATGPLWH